jgi:hypothetical protein
MIRYKVKKMRFAKGRHVTDRPAKLLVEAVSFLRDSLKYSSGRDSNDYLI